MTHHPAFLPVSASPIHGSRAVTGVCSAPRMTLQERNSVAVRSGPSSAPARLRALLSSGELLLMPCCYDGITARLIERAGFDVTFMSGFSVAGSFGLPDTGLLNPTDLAQVLARITAATKLPVIADADTGFGNALNVRRTLTTYFRAGAAGVLLEDQVDPKRCGHTRGKEVVSFEDAMTRMRAACDSRDAFAEAKEDRPVIIGRTDAGRADFEDALRRARGFLEVGADATFVEAPRNIHEMQSYCNEVPGIKLANMLEMGETPVLSPAELKAIGFGIAAYPLTLLSASVRAQEDALSRLKEGGRSEGLIKSFEDLKDIVGFNEYYREEERYARKE